MRIRHDHKVLSVACRSEIGNRGAPAPAVADGRLVVAHALLRGAVKIRIALDPRLDGGVDDRVDDFAAKPIVAHLERATRAVELVFAPLLVFRFTEEGQYAGIVPPLAAALAP